MIPKVFDTFLVTGLTYEIHKEDADLIKHQETLSLEVL